MKYFKILIIGLCINCSLTKVLAQFNFTGTVIDNVTSEPLIGATISVANNKGFTTNLKGEFSFELNKKPNEFVISFVGYQNKIIKAEELNGPITISSSTMELNQIVVSANRMEQKRIEVPAAIGILSKKQIDETKATQIDQLLNQMTGVYMSNLGNESHTMSIRSPLSYRALFSFALDGIPLRPTGDFSHTALKELDQASFERIEILRGPNSSIYGSEAVCGVINAISLNPTLKPSVRFSLQGNDIGYKRVELNASNTFNNTGVFVGGHYGRSRNGWREHSNLDKVGTTFKVAQKISNNTHLNFSSNYILTNSERTGNLDSANFYGKNLTTLHTFTNSKTEVYRGNVTLGHFWNEKSQSNISVFYRNLLGSGIPHFRIRNDKKDPLKATGEISSSGFQSYGSIFQHTQHFSLLNSRLVAGGSLDFSPAMSNKRKIAITRDEFGRYISYKDLNKVFEDYNVDYLNAAGFAQLEVNPFENLRLSGALRYDYFKYKYASTEELTLLAGIINDEVTFSNLTPKVGATYNFNKNKGLYSNFSVGFVPPQIGNVYGADKVNRAIDPQLFNNYEVGAWFSFAKTKGYIDIGLYNLEGKNELVRIVLADGTEEDQNVGKTTHKGVEMTINYQLFKSLSLRVNGTYAHHKYEQFNTGKKDYSGNFMERAPKLILNAAIRYEPAFLEGFRIAFEHQHLGKYFQSPTNDSTKVYPGFNLLHLRAGYNFNQKIRGLEIWFNILNLTDELYAEISDVSAYSGKARYRPGNPRNFNLGIRYSLGR